MQRLMMPGFHAQPSADASTNNSQSQERCFWDSPFLVFCLPLIDAEHKERQHIDDDEISEKNLYERCIHYIHHSNLSKSTETPTLKVVPVVSGEQ